MTCQFPLEKCTCELGKYTDLCKLTLKLQDWIARNNTKGKGSCQCDYCFSWRCAIHEINDIVQTTVGVKRS